jgi:endonuclease/exonuclease/phosphatase family metal-dependent hydrolase
MNTKLKAVLFCLVIIMVFVSCGKSVSLTNPNGQNTTGLVIGTDETLDIVTWNIENYPKHDPETTNYLRSVLPKMKADCIAVQEVDNTTAFYSLVSSFPGWSYRISSSGDTKTAIMYNTATVQVDSSASLFQGMNTPFPRSPLLIKLKWQNQEVYLISLHLKAYDDNVIVMNDSNDNEYRRYYACQLLDQYISTSLHEKKVIVVGDMNDQLIDPVEYNVFMPLLSKPLEYQFADMSIAQHITAQNCSYPRYSSHIDHILISNELFDAFAGSDSFVRTIQMENYITPGGLSIYQTDISDHRPVCIRLKLTP